MTDTLKLEKQLCHRFYTVSNAFTRAYRPLLRALDVTYPQYVVMMALWEQDEVTISWLLDKTRIDGGAMSLMLKKLEAKAYVQVVAGEKDKRIRLVKLTAKGIRARQEAANIPEQMMCRINKLDQDEAQQLINLIDKLSDCLTETTCYPD